MAPARLLALPLLLAAAPAAGHAAVAAAGRSAADQMEEARALYASGEVAAAAEAFRAAAAAAAGDPELAAAAYNNACVLLIELGDHPAALAECERALALRERGDDRRGLARTVNNLGLALQNLGRYAESERAFRRALAINRERGDAEGEAINRANRGATATLAGRYAAALADHRAVAALAAAHAGEPWAAEQERLARLNQAVVLEHLGAYREALELYRGLLAEGEALAPRDRAALEANAGVVYRNLGDPVTALARFAAAEEIYRRLDDLSGLAHVALAAALTRHLNLEHRGAAEAAYRRALALAEEAGDRPREIEILFYLGRLLFELERLDEAEASYRRALAAAEASGSALGRWSAHEGLGRVAEARGDLHGALDHLLAALDEIEAVRAGLERGALRAGFFGALRPAYAATVRVLAALAAAEPGAGWDDRALEVVQRAKARELLEALGPESRPGEPLPAAELFRLARSGPVIEYFAGEGALYRWEIGPAGARLAELGPLAPWAAAANRLHEALTRGEPAPAADLDSLGAALLGGLAALEGRSGGRVRPLRIAPDGRLHYLPFELLPAAGRPLLERATVGYLPSASALGWLEARRRDRAPPAWGAVGFGAPELPGAGDGGVAGAAADAADDPDAGPAGPGAGSDAGDSVVDSPAGLLVSRFDLGPLPAAAAELKLATAALPGPHLVRLGGEATEGAFREAVAAGAAVVHLATHTVIDERPGRGAAILLSPAGADDGLLRPEEVAALPYDARLTVLASCRTALDPGQDGRALSALTGAFVAAGSDAVVATLWDVGDAATAAFMEQFYFELARGRAPAAALARAKRRLAADPRWADPSLWAGYVLVGESPPPAPRRGLPAAFWAALAAAVALALPVVRLLVRRRRSQTVPTG